MPEPTLPTGDAPVPYTADELAVARPIIERYNPPENPQRRLLATLDALLGEHQADETAPTADLRLAAVARCCQALRVEVDRLDAAVDVADVDRGATSLTAWAIVLRDCLDGLETDLDARAAGLTMQAAVDTGAAVRCVVCGDVLRPDQLADHAEGHQ